MSLIPDRSELEALELDEDPSEWPRVKVIRGATGAQEWCFIPDIQDEDVIPLTKDGLPWTMYKNPGRRPELSEADTEVTKAGKTQSPLNQKILEKRLRDKQAAIDHDPMVQLLKQNIDSTAVLQMAIVALAEEQAALKFDRLQVEKTGDSGTSHSVRRIAALEKLAQNWLKRKDALDSSSVDLESKAFATVFQFIAETIMECLESAGVRSETSNSVMTAFSRKVDDDTWLIEARNRIKNMNS
jgi:hypothetical protein